VVSEALFQILKLRKKQLIRQDFHLIDTGAVFVDSDVQVGVHASGEKKSESDKKKPVFGPG
jgi:hypothetical protein